MNEIPKPKLVAVTHNYIGSNLKQSRPNSCVEGDAGVAICLSGEHLYAIEKPLPSCEKNWQRMIELVRDPEIANQQPNSLLLYVGKSNVGEALSFAIRFVGSVIHLVINDEHLAKYDMQVALNSRHWPFSPVLHLGETTGNLTMERLVNEFLRTGSIAPEPVWLC